MVIISHRCFFIPPFSIDRFPMDLELTISIFAPFNHENKADPYYIYFNKEGIYSFIVKLFIFNQ
jgi:hypothetical protein